MDDSRADVFDVNESLSEPRYRVRFQTRGGE
jgi:hypothetical protein